MSKRSCPWGFKLPPFTGPLVRVSAIEARGMRGRKWAVSGSFTSDVDYWWIDARRLKRERRRRKQPQRLRFSVAMDPNSWS
ncbi:MAG TPA: hypothetical protein VNH41_04295 [Steroidobacteraceae bacterium]|nr:hypothetical protein [Steroidobacteraceae bacterium]